MRVPLDRMKKILEKKLRNLNVVIASHIFATGPALELEQYLYPKVKSLLFIGHPFSFRKEISSFRRYYKYGEKIYEKKAIAWYFPEVFIYLKDALYTFLWVLLLKDKTNLFVGSDNFLAYLGLVLKKLGRVEKVVLYTIDYLPERFNNPILNNLYRFFDRKCLKNCSVVWNVSAEIASARKKYGGINPVNSVKQIVVPLGIWYQRISKYSLEEKDSNTVVFMGHLLEKQGLDVVIKAFSKIIENVSNATLKIIGTGAYEVILKDLVNRLKLQEKILFLGYIEDHKKVEEIMARATIAVATYKPDPESFTYFADPGKIKNYLACGLPVLLTDVPPIAKILEEERCGIICSYDENDVADKIIHLMKNRKKLHLYSRNAREFAKNFDWNKIFAGALSWI